jgi:hypothetical protein
MSNNLGAPTLAVNQLAKETTINDAVGRIDASLTERLAITVVSGNTNITPTTSQLQQAIFIELVPDGTTPPISTETPKLLLQVALKKVYIVKNNCACTFTIERTSNNLGGVNLPPGDSLIILNSNTAIPYSLLSFGSSVSSVVKREVRVATSNNVTISTGLNSGDIVDGVTLANGDRVLLFGQTTASQNGIYVVSATPIRSTDADSTGDIVPNTLVPVSQGSLSGKIIQCTNIGIPVIGTDSIIFSVIGSAITPYLAALFVGGVPPTSSLIWRLITTEVGFYFPDNFVESKGRVATNPTATTDFDVRRNGTTIGTISVSTAGVFTFSTVGSTTEVFVEDDVLDVVSPATLNGLTDLAVSWRGFRS